MLDWKFGSQIERAVGLRRTKMPNGKRGSCPSCRPVPFRATQAVTTQAVNPHGCRSVLRGSEPILWRSIAEAYESFLGKTDVRRVQADVGRLNIRRNANRPVTPMPRSAIELGSGTTVRATAIPDAVKGAELPVT